MTDLTENKPADPALDLAAPPTDLPTRTASIRRTRPTLTCERCFAVLGPERIHMTGVSKVPGPDGVEAVRTTYRANCPCGTAYDLTPPPGVELDLGPAPSRTFVPKGSERNAPCPCGSGKKVKRCHPEGVVVPD